MGKSEQQDAVNLSSVFSSATKSLCDLSHITSSPSTSTSLPPERECSLLSPTLLPVYFYSDSQILVAATASCHSSYIQLLTRLGPYISLDTDVVKPRVPVF